MRITMKEKVFFGYFQGWTITIDGIKYPREKGKVYTAKSALRALSDCLELDRQGCDVSNIIKTEKIEP